MYVTKITFAAITALFNLIKGDISFLNLKLIVSDKVEVALVRLCLYLTVKVAAEAKEKFTTNSKATSNFLQT